MEVQHLCESFWEQVVVGDDLDGCASAQQHLFGFTSQGKKGMF